MNHNGNAEALDIANCFDEIGDNWINLLYNDPRYIGRPVIYGGNILVDGNVVDLNTLNLVGILNELRERLNDFIPVIEARVNGLRFQLAGYGDYYYHVNRIIKC